VPTVPVAKAPTTTVSQAGTAVAPTLTADPPPGLSLADVAVTLTTDDPSAVIWYTTDGSTPDLRKSAIYTSPIQLVGSEMIRAVAANAYGSDELAGVWLEGDATAANVSSNLPLVVLWSEGKAPTFKDDVYTAFSVSTFEPPVGGRATWPATATLSARAGLKIRGSSTAYDPKHPYRLETWGPLDDDDQGVVMLGMPSEADWVLGAPMDFDRAFMRDALMFALSNDLGRYAPRTEFAEVFVAERGERVGLDDYVGIYVITEHIEQGPDRVDIAKLLPTDVAEPEVTGGYIFKEDRTGPDETGFTAGTAGGVFSFQQPFVYSDPEEDQIEPEQSAYLIAQLDELGGALASPDFTNPTTGRHYSDIIDVDAWVDHHILNVLAKNPDAFRLSGYYHKDREGPIAAGPIWDFDRTLGCSSDTRAADPTWWDASNVTSDCTYVFEEAFWKGLFADPAFRATYFARWGVLLDNQLSIASIDAVIDGMAARLEEAAPRDYAAWPAYPPRGGSFDSEVALLKTWIAARHDWIAGCLALPDPRTCRGD
jgi:hypothetical protein